MKKQGWILIAVTGAFICLLLGIFIGRNTQKAYIKTENNQIEQPLATIPSSTPSQGKLDINTATAEQLQLLPGIGQTLAQRIIDYRNQNGNYTSTEDLLNVSGIGEKKLDAIKDYITVN